MGSSGHLSTILRHLGHLAGLGSAGVTPDGQLLERFLTLRDEDAFAALVGRHAPLVLGVCQRVLHDSHAVEDAFQATFLVLVRKAGSITHPDRLGPWLYGVAYRVAVRARANAAKRRFHESQVIAMPMTDVSDEVAWRDLRPLLDQEVSRLPEKYRVPFVLCYLEGKTNEEAAHIMGCPKGTILSRLARGRERLRARLSRRGVTLSAGLLAAGLSRGATSAAVPGMLMLSTTKAVLLFAEGKAATADGLSAEAVALAKEVTRAMIMHKVRIAMVLTLLVTAAGAGAAALTHQALVRDRTEEKPAEPPSTTAKNGRDRPEGENQALTDPFGDPLPPGAVARMGTRRLREEGLVSSLAFAPDGQSLLASSTAGPIHRWEVATGRELKRWSIGVPTAGRTLAFSPDSRMAVWSLTSDLHLWDLAAEKELREFTGHKDSIDCAAFAPGGKTLASGSMDKTTRLWDVATGKELHKLTGHQFGVGALAFSPDGRVLATVSEIVRLWDVTTGKELNQLRGPPRSTVRLIFSPDGKIIASAERDKTIRLWDATTGKELRRLEGHTAEAKALVFANGGNTLASTDWGGDYSVRIWDVATGKELHRLLGPRGHVYCLAVSPDGKTLASGSEDRTIHLWDVASGEHLRGGEGHVIVVGTLALSPDGKTLASTGGVAGSYFPTILWDTATGKELARIAGPGREGWMLAFTPDGKALMSLTSHGIVFSDPATTKELHSIGTPRGYVYFALSSDGKSIVFAAGDRDVRPRVGRTLPGYVEVTRVELATRKVLGQFRGDDGKGVQAFALSGDGKTLIVETSNDRKVHLWDTGTGKERSAFARPQGYFLVLSPDAKLIAWWRIDEEGTIRLSETTTGEELRRLVLVKQMPRYVGGERNAQPVFSPDGKRLAATTGNTICVWDVATGKELKRFQGDQGVVTAMGFSVDCNFLATAGADTTVLVWNVSALSRKP